MSFVVSTVDPLKRLLDSYFVDVIFIIYYGDEGKNCVRLHFLKMFTAIFLFLHALNNPCHTNIKTRSAFSIPFNLEGVVYALSKRVQ